MNVLLSIIKSKFIFFQAQFIKNHFISALQKHMYNNNTVKHNAVSNTIVEYCPAAFINSQTNVSCISALSLNMTSLGWW